MGTVAITFFKSATLNSSFCLRLGAPQLELTLEVGEGEETTWSDGVT